MAHLHCARCRTGSLWHCTIIAAAKTAWQLQLLVYSSQSTLQICCHTGPLSIHGYWPAIISLQFMG